MSDSRTVSMAAVPAVTLRQLVAVVLGAVAVAVGAQVAVPLPSTPVPATFQVPAVLIVGGLLGPRLGAVSMGVYLVMGALGLPVFAPTGVPALARLIGPTGGYLLAFPIAAALVGAMVHVPVRPVRLTLALMLGLVAIHVGGVAQLVIITGDWSGALVLGSLPFLWGDMLKLLFAGLILWRFSRTIRARL